MTLADEATFFASVHNGQPLEVEDPSNRDQCMDLAFGWTDYLGIPREAIRHLDAYQVFTEANDTTYKYFDVISFHAGMSAQPGDLVVWKADGRFTGSAGHIDLALPGSTVSTLRALDQNWAGHLYCEILPHPYDDVIGLLRPITNQGDDMASKEQLIELYKLAFPNQDVNAEWVKKFIGQDMSDVLQNLRDDPSRQNYVTELVNDAAAFRNGGNGQATELSPGVYRVK